MQKSPHIVARRLGERLLLLPLSPGSEGLWAFELNEPGAFVWERLPSNLPELARAVSLEFDVALEQAVADVGAFLEDLRGVGAAA